MAIAPIPPVGNIAQVSQLGSVNPTPTDAGEGFSGVVKNFLTQVNNEQGNVDNELQKLVTGESDSIQDLVLTMAEADTSFRLIMEIRNKLLDSYREIMQMQI